MTAIDKFIGRQKTGIHLALFALVCALYAMSVQATVTATIDRNSVSEQELLTLTIRVNGESPAVEPDFTPLEQDFQIVNSGSKTSSSISIINGRRVQNNRTEYILKLLPLRLGRLIIPSIQVGKELTSAIPIQSVRQSAAATRQMNQLVFFDTSVDTNATYVQSQIIYSVKLFYSESVAGDFPAPPNIEDVVIEALETERRYEAIVNNRRYYVLEKRYAIFPQKSGSLIIPRETFVGSRGRGGLFSSRQRVSAVSKQHRVIISTIPSKFTGDNWIPATQFTLSETWTQNPPQFRVGEPINRQLTMTAVGLASSLLPPFQALQLDNAKTYADPPESIEQVSQEGISSINTTTIGIVPIKEGRLVLPEIRIPWWNTKTDSLELAVIPESSYEVLPAIGSVSVSPVVRLPKQAQSVPAQTTPQDRSPWIALTTMLALLLLFVSWRWWLLREKVQGLLADEKTNAGSGAQEFITPSEQQAFKEFSQVCKSGDASAVQGKLFAWGKIRFPAIKSNQDLARQAGSEKLVYALQDLDKTLYAPNTNPSGEGDVSQTREWQGQALLDAVKTLRQQKAPQGRKAFLQQSLNPA